jgi:RimJ/RimL family protein N-acetyltransferase
MMIETTRLLLRPMHATDTTELLHIFADPVVMAAFDAAPFDRRQMEQWVRDNLAHQERHGYGLYTVIEKADGAVIGDCGLTVMDSGGVTEVELGYDFRRDRWGRGFATEAALAVRDAAFLRLGLPRLISLIRHGNRASRRVAEKVGMTLERDIVRHTRPYWLYACSRTG